MVMLVFGFAFFYSCTTDEVGPILEDITPSVLASTATGDVILLEEDSLNVFSDFQWTEAQANLNISLSYALEMDTADNNFADAIALDYEEPFEFSPIVKDMNDLFVKSGFSYGTMSSIEYRVVTNVTGVDPIYSNIVSMNVTPYEIVIDYGNVFLLGSGTQPGWDNANALPLTHLGDGVFEITATLTASPDEIKFIGVLTQWAPQWGTDDLGTWDAGNLVFRPDETVPDPAAIPAPPTAGDYVITADIVNLTYTVVAAK